MNVSSQHKTFLSTNHVNDKIKIEKKTSKEIVFRDSGGVSQVVDADTCVCEEENREHVNLSQTFIIDLTPYCYLLVLLICVVYR